MHEEQSKMHAISMLKNKTYVCIRKMLKYLDTDIQWINKQQSSHFDQNKK